MFLQATIKLSNNEKKVVTIYLTLMKKNFTKIFSKDFLVQRVLEQYQRVPGSWALTSVILVFYFVFHQMFPATVQPSDQITTVN